MRARVGVDDLQGDLQRLLDGAAPDISELALDLVDCVMACQPAFGAKVRFGWRSVNFRHPRAGHVCAIFPMKAEVLLVFEHGRLLADPQGLLEGETRQVRTLKLRPGMAIPRRSIAELLGKAVALKG